MSLVNDAEEFMKRLEDFKSRKGMEPEHSTGGGMEQPATPRGYDHIDRRESDSIGGGGGGGRGNGGGSKRGNSDTALGGGGGVPPGGAGRKAEEDGRGTRARTDHEREAKVRQETRRTPRSPRYCGQFFVHLC